MMGGSVKKVRISGSLLVNVLSQGTGACHAVVGIPINSILVGCRMAEAQVLELDFFSYEWDEGHRDEVFTVVFRRQADAGDEG